MIHSKNNTSQNTHFSVFLVISVITSGILKDTKKALIHMNAFPFKTVAILT